MKKRLIIILYLISPCIHSYGQTDSSKSQSTVIYFGDGSQTADANANKNYSASAVKLGIFSVVSGLYGGYYEREFSDLFSIELGAGITGRNWVYGIMSGEEGFGGKPQTSSFFISDNDIVDEDYNYTSRECKPGFFVSATPKFYYADEDGMDGSYLGFNFQYRRYNYTAYGEVDPLDQSNFTSSSEDLDEFENQTILSLRWGYQNLNDKTIIDYFTGIGIRNFKGERRDLGYAPPPTDNLVIIAPELRNTKGTKFFFEVGMNIGLWWDKK